MSYTVKDFLKTPLFVSDGYGPRDSPSPQLSSYLEALLLTAPHKPAALLFSFPHCQILFLSGALHVYSNVNQVNFSYLFHSLAWCPRSTPKCLIKKKMPKIREKFLSPLEKRRIIHTYLYLIFFFYCSHGHIW